MYILIEVSLKLQRGIPYPSFENGRAKYSSHFNFSFIMPCVGSPQKLDAYGKQKWSVIVDY